MKKYILMAAVLTVSVVASAKTWRINPNAAAKPDFTSLKAACDAKKVVKGDTLYCEPGLYTNEDENYITKNCLTILGPGFGFKGAFGSTSTIAEAHFPAIMHVKADTINIIGLKVKNMFIDGDYYGVRMDLVFERNYIGRLYHNPRYMRRITVRNNFFSASFHDSGNSPIDLSGSELQNIDIQNNIIASLYYGVTVNAGSNTSALIAHNTIICDMYSNYSAISADYSVIRDNIVINKNPDRGSSVLIEFNRISTCNVHNNVFSLDPDLVDASILSQYGTDNYFAKATLANTFTCTKIDNAEETYYQLKEGSVAKNKAYQGEDCGAFAGSWPFIIYGRPQGLPYIYDVKAPATPTDDQLTITFKVKANNE